MLDRNISAVPQKVQLEWDSLPPEENKILRHPPGVTSTERLAKVKAAPKPNQVDE